MGQRSRFLRRAAAAVLAAMLPLWIPTVAGAIERGSAPATRSQTGRRGDVKPLPRFVRKWQGSKEKAADLVARGKAQPDQGGVVTLPNGQFVEHRLEGTDHIVTLLAEFSDPAHNQIAQPDRGVDNSTYWNGNFDRAHYREMLFSDGGGSYGMPSMRDYYRQVSSGRYTVDGQVSDWVGIDQPESLYGANGRDGAGSDNLNGPVYRVVRDALLATATQNEDINWDPAVVDIWDRYDCDGDGNFTESDGYIDHFQVVHAGQGEEEGGGAQGGDAIWSHRWYANYDPTTGPASCKLGGYQVPGTNLWVGDYTIEPENGAVGVFAHEFGHDLGLPDLYDTNGGDNGTGFWTIMSSGSWASDDDDAIGTKPVHFGPWEKLVLGWLDLDTASAGTNTTVDLGPAEGSSKNGAQALRINLPNYTKTTTLFAPEESDPHYYYSGSGDDLDQRMAHSFGGALSAATPLTFRTNYDIELDWDYAYVETTSDGTTWTPVQTNLSSSTNPNGQNFGHGITGSSDGAWVDGAATLPAGTTGVRFRYWTDGAVANPGFAVDSISVGSFSDDASNTGAWAFDGFSQITNGQVTKSYFHYYLVESRSYVRNDESLCGTYNFLWGNWLEKQCYQRGLLVWYRNSAFADNNTSAHAGGAQIMPVDASPTPLVSPDGKGYLRGRWQVWDAPFSVDANNVTLHEQKSPNGRVWERTYSDGKNLVFFDSSPTAYWDARIPRASVKTAGSGIHVEIVGVSPDRTSYRVHLY